ncbi:MAG: L-serine ammonia-lyase, iron-sulfur-dependent, subunit alpha, partial [Bacillota bacterium]|nr:L-serine ammonia-lyase, iron-sulfur-dependent, subunit alpha [Bacillota bacterium]
MSLEQSIISTLRAEVIPAMGCTEPVAVALAVSKARELSELKTTDLDKVEAIEVSVSPNIFKNGLSVGIPGTKEVGLIMAIALGYCACYSRDGLEVFESVHEKELERAKILIESNKIILKMEDTSDKIFIHAKISTIDGFSRAIIKDRHDQFVLLEDDHGIMFEQTLEKADAPKNNPLYSEPILEIIKAVENMPHGSLDFLLDGLEMNQHIANYGLMNKCGMGVGYILNKQVENGLLGKDLMNRAMVMTAAASDARMSGVSLPVMSSNGSGNNGLTALLPIVAYSEKNNISDEKLAKAAAMSHLINGTIKNAI